MTRTKQLERDARHFAAIIGSSDDAIVSKTLDAIVSKTLDGTVVTWNAGGGKALRIHAAEIVGQSIRLIVPPDRQPKKIRS